MGKKIFTFLRWNFVWINLWYSSLYTWDHEKVSEYYQEYHNHTLQTNPVEPTVLEEETQNANKLQLQLWGVPEKMLNNLYIFKYWKMQKKVFFQCYKTMLVCQPQ